MKYYFLVSLFLTLNTVYAQIGGAPNSTVTIITEKERLEKQKKAQEIHSKTNKLEAIDAKPTIQAVDKASNKLADKSTDKLINKSANKLDTLPSVKSIVEKKLYDPNNYLERSSITVFASFSIPEDSLKKLLADAAKYKALVVFNGLYKNDLSKTQQKIGEIIFPEYKKLKNINPKDISAEMLKFKKTYQDNKISMPKITFSSKQFKDEKIKQVPAFLLTSPLHQLPKCDNNGCDLSMIKSTVYGDVSIDYALDVFYRQSAGQANIAKYFLNKK